MTDLLLKQGRIIDGTGSPARAGDVRIKAGRIVEIGTDLAAGSEAVVELEGAFVAPGFIDLHTHYDGSLYWDPACDPIMLHGVTTVLIGNCSLGLAPLKQEDRAMLSGLFSFIEDVPAAVFDETVPWTWETFEDYAAELRARAFGPNILVLVSHSLLRQFVMGPEAWRRASTPAEVGEIADLLARALRAGAAGISSSRFDRNPAGEPVPSFYADDAELDRVFAVLAEHESVFQFIGRVPNVDDFVEDVGRIGGFSARHGVPVLSNAMYQRPENPAAHMRLQEAADRVNAAGGAFHHLVSPRPIELPLRFHESFAMSSCGAWNELIATPVDRKAALASDPAWRERARRDWEGAVFSKRTDGMRIVEVGSDALADWIGRSLADLVAQRGGNSSDVLADWLIENGFASSFVFPVSNLDLDAVADMLVAGGNLISGSDAGAHYKMFCGAGDTSLILQRHVRERGDLTLEDAIKRMTADQARVMGMADRGTIAPGAIADLVVFRLDEVEWEREYYVRDVPGDGERLTRPAGGFLYTIVAGKVAQRGGVYSGLLAGQLIERAAATVPA